MKHGVWSAADGFYNPLRARRIILKWIFKTWDGAWTRLIWLRIGTDDVFS
jgi:hypothetical protein